MNMSVNAKIFTHLLVKINVDAALDVFAYISIYLTQVATYVAQSARLCHKRCKLEVYATILTKNWCFQEKNLIGSNLGYLLLMNFDPIKLELYKNILTSVAEEMGVTLPEDCIFTEYQRATGFFLCCL